MKAHDIAQSLAEVEFFKGLESGHVGFIAECATKREVDADEVLFRFDQEADSFYLVLSGEVTLEVAAIEGPSLELQHAGPGSVLGWSWLIPPYRWSFQGRAEEPVVMLEFDGKRIREQCEKDAALGYAVLKRFAELMSERLAFARQRMVDEWKVPGFA